MDKVIVNISYLDSRMEQTLTTTEATSKLFLEQVMRCLTNRNDLLFVYEDGTILIPYPVLIKTIFSI